MSLLSRVTSGIVKKSHYIILYGEPGIGKSTFASDAPSPIFLCTEDGTNNLDVNRLRINSFAEMKAALAELATGNHNFKTVVIDTIDHFEPMVWQEVLAENPKYKSIEKIPYTKGYIEALDFWTDFALSLEAAREKGLNVIMLAHSFVKAHNDPQLEEAYDRHQIKLHHKAALLLVDRVDCVLFSTHKTFLDKKESGKHKAYGDGSRVVYTENRPAFLAKNRFKLPFIIPLEWDEFSQACDAPKSESSSAVKEKIAELLKEVKDIAVRKKVEDKLKEIGDNPKGLTAIENRLKIIISA